MIGGFKFYPPRTQALRGALALLGLVVGCSGGSTESANVGWGGSGAAVVDSQTATGVSDHSRSAGRTDAGEASGGAGELSGGGEPAAAGDSGAEVTVTLPGGESALADQLVIKRAPGITREALVTGLSAFGARVISEGDLLSLELGYDTIELPTGMSLAEAEQQLAALGLSVSSEPVVMVPLDVVANDPLYSSLWAMPKLHAPDAWDRTTGSRDVLVAIVDTGIDATHPDLAPNLWHNPGEIPGNGIDDDHNGFVDDVSGWNFVNGSNAPADDVGHGSHVAGTIGAVGNNGIGVVGVNFKVSLLPLKVCSPTGCATTATVNAVLYATKMHAKVANASLGGFYSPLAYERDALRAFGDAGGIFVAAAGNSSNDNDVHPSLPASYDLDNIVSVAANDSADRLASFSNWGRTSVDLGAPGVDILSSVPGGNYTKYSGTSMASPHVAGAVALLWSATPTATRQEVRQALFNSVTPLASLAGKVVSGGRLDLGALIQMGAGCDPHQPNCGAHAACVPQGSRNVCLCDAGFRGDGHTCADIDECAESHPCDPNATCDNTPGSYTCTCLPGLGGDGKTCKDIDECQTGAAKCNPGALCENTLGHYLCRCPEGAVCAGVDLCAPGLSGCDANAVCSNASGSYSCECKPGYAGDGLACVDIDECAALGISCGGHGACRDLPGGHSCACDAGYESVGDACVDIDECAGQNPCGAGAACVNTDGAYRCECPAGYALGAQGCEDVDECALGGGCSADAVCSNLPGSFACSCKSGFVGDGHFCTDVDECANGSAGCGQHAGCTNTRGGFVCACLPGYAGDGFSCSNVDECQLGLADCSAHADCADTDGSYECACQAGYQGDGKTCNDVDECAQAAQPCGSTATCRNTDGGFSCECKRGFHYDGHACVDDDECATGQALCSPNALCSNVVGSYRCSCNPGFVGSGFICEDVNECALWPRVCASDQTCSNTPGGYMCLSAGGGGGGGGSSGTGGTTGSGGSSGTGGTTGSGGTSGTGGTTGSGSTGSGGTTSGGSASTGGTTGSGATSGTGGTASGGSTGTGGTSGSGGTGGTTGGGSTGSGGTGGTTGAGGSGGIAGSGGTSGSGGSGGTGGTTGGGSAGSGGSGGTGGGESAPVPHIVALDTRGSHSCTLLDNGAVRCWGRNDFGQLGYGNTSPVGDDEAADSVGVVQLGARAVGLSVGVSHTCALLETGGVRCWGRNVYGQLGTLSYETIGDDELPSAGVNVDVGGTVTKLAAGGEHTCALLSTGAVRCWGLNVHGQLGYGNTQNVGAVLRPAQAGDVPLGGKAVDVVAGRDHTCALLDTGAVRCWGRGQFGALGYGSPSDVGDDESPAQVGDVPLGGPALELSAGWYHTCARLQSGVRCWGYGGLGELGTVSTQTIGDDEPASASAIVNLGGQAVQLSAGLHHSCAVLGNGKLRCWGYGMDGRLGYANLDNIGDDETPASAGDVEVGQSVLSVRAGGAHTCALLADLSVLCWGDGAFGELGTGNAATIGDDETPLGGGPALSQLDACVAGASACSVHATCSNTFYGFGCSCNTGYVGDGFSCTLAPAIVSVVAGAEHTCALTNLGSVRCWGAASFGRLGYPGSSNLGDDEAPKTAGDVDVGGTVTQLVAGDLHTCALLQSGAVRCWGAGAQGQLGYANTNNVGDDETPASVGDVPLGAKASALAAGQYHTCALLQSGAVRCWGAGSAGRLGYGNTSSIGDNETPASAGDVPLGAPALTISAGQEHTCALLSGGKVRCWGNGVNGQLGYGVASKGIVGDDEPPSAAGDVPLGAAALSVTAGGTHTCARLTGGAVRCWGYGRYGALGYGNTQTVGDDEPVSSVGNVNVGGNVVELALGLNHTCARLDTGSVRCWGYGSNGALGYASTLNVGDAKTPAAAGDVNLGGAALQLGAGQNHSCAVLANGVRCWGLGALGRLGYANTSTLGDNETPASAGFVSVL